MNADTQLANSSSVPQKFACLHPSNGTVASGSTDVDALVDRAGLRGMLP